MDGGDTWERGNLSQYAMKKFCIILLFCNLACVRSPMPEDSQRVPVSFSLDTKSLGEGERTFRVTLLHQYTHEFLSQGTYCNSIIDHSSTVTDGRWLSPCRVDNDGNPLQADNSEAFGLAEADKDSKWGLRYNTGVNLSSRMYIAAASPAKALSADGNLRYYRWIPTAEFYVSDATIVRLSGTWLNGEYVFNASGSDALTLKDRRARLKVHIECGELSTAYIQSVELLNCVTAARWYLTTGFSSSNFTTGNYTLFDYIDDNAGSVRTLIKNSVDWDSTLEVFLPAIDYSSDTYAAMRPKIKVLMGNDPAHPSEAVVDITEPTDPMKNYTFNLLVSKSEVVVTLSAAPWDDGGTISSVDNEEPAVIGTVTISSWTNNTGDTTSDDWNTHF